MTVLSGSADFRNTDKRAPNPDKWGLSVNGQA